MEIVTRNFSAMKYIRYTNSFTAETLTTFLEKFCCNVSRTLNWIIIYMSETSNLEQWIIVYLILDSIRETKIDKKKMNDDEIAKLTTTFYVGLLLAVSSSRKFCVLRNDSSTKFRVAFVYIAIKIALVNDAESAAQLKRSTSLHFRSCRRRWGIP